MCFEWKKKSICNDPQSTSSGGTTSSGGIMRVAALPRPPDARVLFPVEDSRWLYFQRDFFAHDICMGRTILSVNLECW